MEIGEREMEIPCHEHMLRLKLLDDVEKRGDDDDDVLCDGCNESFTRGGWAYGCTQCSFYLHLWCARLPQELQHILHPQRPLTLVARAPYRPQTFHCKACRRTISRGFSYNCSDCGFDLDVNCVAFLVAISTRFCSQILHPSHQHPFLVCYMNPYYYSKLNYATIHCSRCGLFLENRVYVCTECILLLHPSCAQLGQEIEENPFHPQHHLKLNQSADATLRLYKCNICGDRLDLFAYSCAADADSDSRCLFKMDLKCALQIPPVEAFEIHQHPLTFYNKAPKPQINCNICDQFIKYPFLLCMECKNFNVHVHCFPKLPLTSESRHHQVHCLSLIRSPIKDHPDEDESSEFYCDHCEERRQLCDPCYCCLECDYFVHVHCAFPEILDSIGKKSPFVAAQNEEEKVLTELNEEIAILEEGIKVETTQLDTLKTELKKIMDKHELFFKIGMSALKFA